MLISFAIAVYISIYIIYIYIYLSLSLSHWLRHLLTAQRQLWVEVYTGELGLGSGAATEPGVARSWQVHVNEAKKGVPFGNLT